VVGALLVAVGVILLLGLRLPTSRTFQGALVSLVGYFIAAGSFYALVRERRQARGLLSLDQLSAGQRRAGEELQALRFRQTRSAGWTAGLRTSLGPHAALQNRLDIAEVERTLPDEVARLRGFIDFLTTQSRQEHRVLIGVDELDKMESDETARRFINDIKALFGLENCFYLVSVSEDALSAFERRGLPYRDVFDSAFDEILVVGYLDLEAARRLLRRRVLGMPPGFQALCFVLAGGLARDLIRVARAVMRTGPEGRMVSLTDTALELARADLRGKRDAVLIEARRLQDSTATRSLLRAVGAIEPHTASAPELVATCLTLSRQFDPTGLPADIGSQVSTVTTEVIVYLYWLATVMQTFGRAGDLGPIERSLEGQSRDLEMLADCKRQFAHSPHLAWDSIEAFRFRTGLDTERRRVSVL